MKKIIYCIAAAAVALSGCARQQKAEAPTGNVDTTSVSHADWSRNAVIYEVNTRQFTPEGTFKAFIPHIDRLKELGVDILWFMPIHPISEDGRKGELGSYYAVRDYKGVNPEFGTIDDFREVVKAAHAAGMKVIIDWVPNHSGRDNAWVTEHPDWYARDDKGEMFGPFDWTDVYKFDYSVPEMRAAMIDAMQYWLKEADIDGFRCDVAGQVPTDFWNEARPALDSVKSPLFMLAEATEPELMDEAFDMGYNWPMKDLFSAIASTSGQYTFVKPGESEKRSYPETHAADIVKLLAEQDSIYPVDSYMMNMITNHDLNSWEGTEFERLGNLQGAFAVLSYTLPGMPLIYTGQETGLNRALEFFVKDEAPAWEPRNEYFTFYQKLNALKHSRKELRAGTEGGAVKVYATDSPDVLVFGRTDAATGATTLTGVNLGKEAAAVKFTGEAPAVDGAVDAMSGESATLPATLGAGEYFIYTIG